MKNSLKTLAQKGILITVGLAGVVGCSPSREEQLPEIYQGLPQEFYTKKVSIREIDPRLIEEYKKGRISYGILSDILDDKPGMGRKLIDVQLSPEEEKELREKGYILR